MHSERALILIILWLLSAGYVVRQFGIFRLVWYKLKAFWKWPWLRRIAVAYFSLPFAGLFILGVVAAVYTTLNVWYRTHPTNINSTNVSYVNETDVSSSAYDEQQARLEQRLIDSLQKSGPIGYNTPLPPFVTRKESIPGTHSSALLLHCRIWCECRTTDSTSPGYLPPGTFQLLIFQLSPTTQSYELKADTVMRWEDYVKPFTLKLVSKEVSS